MTVYFVCTRNCYLSSTKRKMKRFMKEYPLEDVKMLYKDELTRDILIDIIKSVGISEVVGPMHISGSYLSGLSDSQAEIYRRFSAKYKQGDIRTSMVIDSIVENTFLTRPYFAYNTVTGVFVHTFKNTTQWTTSLISPLKKTNTLYKKVKNDLALGLALRTYPESPREPYKREYELPSNYDILDELEYPE